MPDQQDQPMRPVATPKVKKAA